MSKSEFQGTDIGLLWLRVVTGLGMAYHGYTKIFSGEMNWFAAAVKNLGFPMPDFFAWAAAFSEFGGGILLILGLCTRPASFLICITMSVAAFIQHGPDPFSKKELALAYWAISLAFILAGPGKYSIDQKVIGKIRI